MKRKLFAIWLMLLLVACAGVQEKWNTLTPDQKARVVINDLQAQLDKKFDETKAYVALKPELQAVWKSDIVPAFDVANRALKSSMVLAQAGKIGPDQVYATVSPLMANVVNLLLKYKIVK